MELFESTKTRFSPHILAGILGHTWVVSLLAPCFWVIFRALPLEWGVTLADIWALPHFFHFPRCRSKTRALAGTGRLHVGRWAPQNVLQPLFCSSILLQLLSFQLVTSRSEEVMSSTNPMEFSQLAGNTWQLHRIARDPKGLHDTGGVGEWASSFPSACLHWCGACVSLFERARRQSCKHLGDLFN